MNVPRPAMQKQLKDQEKELTDDITSLNKKVRLSSIAQMLVLTIHQSKFLEKQFNDAQNQLRDIVS